MSDNIDYNARAKDLEAIVGEVSRRMRNALAPTSQRERNIELAETPIPHSATFQAFANTLAKTYWTTDEAIKVAWENARFMKNDLAVMECVEMRRRSVALLEWHVVPDNPNDKRQVEAAGTVERIVKRTPRFIQFRENLLYALWYGKYGIQMAWGQTLIDGKPRYYIRHWIPINGDKIVYKVMQGTPFENERVGIRIGYNQGRSTLPEKYQGQIGPTDRGMAYFLTDEQRDRFIVHRHMVEDGDYDDPYSGGTIFGVGIRSRIYWTWYLMKETLAWLMEYIERSASGFEIWYYPEGNEKAREACRRAAEDRVGHSGNIVLVPKAVGGDGGYSMQRIEPSMSGAQICMNIVKEFFQHQIKRYILGQTLTTEAAGTGLGSNLATIHLETYLQIIKYDAINLEETLTNDLVEKIRKFNFPNLDEMSLRFRIETDEIDHHDRLNSIRSLYDMGVPISQEQALRAAGMTAPKDDEPVLTNPAIESFKQSQQPGGGLEALLGGLGGLGESGGEGGEEELPEAEEPQVETSGETENAGTDAV